MLINMGGSASVLNANTATKYTQSVNVRKTSWLKTTRRARKHQKISIYYGWGKHAVRARGFDIVGGTGGIIFLLQRHRDKAHLIARQFMSQLFPINIVFVDGGKRGRMSLKGVCGIPKARIDADTAVMVSVLNKEVKVVQKMLLSAVDQWCRMSVFPTPDKVVWCEYIKH